MFNIDRRSFILRGEAFAKKFIAMRSTRFCPACLATDSASNSPINAARYSRLSLALRRPIHHLPLMQQRAALTRSRGLRKVDIFVMTYPWLALRSKLTELELVRRVFRGHYLATMTGLFDDPVFGQPLESPQLSTPNKIANSEGVDPSRLRKLLIGKGFISTKTEEGEDLDVSVPYFEALAAAAEMKGAVSVKQGIAMMNVSRTILIEHGYLPKIGAGSEHSSVKCKAVDQIIIKQLLLRIECLTDQVDAMPRQYRGLAKCAEISKVPLDKIIPAFLDGRMRTAKRFKSLAGMKALLLDSNEVTSILGAQIRSGSTTTKKIRILH